MVSSTSSRRSEHKLSYWYITLSHSFIGIYLTTSNHTAKWAGILIMERVALYISCFYKMFKLWVALLLLLVHTAVMPFSSLKDKQLQGNNINLKVWCVLIVSKRKLLFTMAHFYPALQFICVRNDIVYQYQGPGFRFEGSQIVWCLQFLNVLLQIQQKSLYWWLTCIQMQRRLITC